MSNDDEGRHDAINDGRSNTSSFGKITSSPTWEDCDVSGTDSGIISISSSGSDPVCRNISVTK